MDDSNTKLFINEYGDKILWKEGKWHRVDGPAWEYINGDKFWYILGKYLKEKEFNSWMIRIQKCI